MLKIGNYNKLAVSRIVDFGLYLDAGNGQEILLPKRYIETLPEPGDLMDVFVYKDSENRLIATTEHPFATVGEFAYMKVKDTNKVGAFLEWGIMKDILVPYREQRSTMVKDGTYLVYIYLDDATKRIVASSKIEKFLGNLIPEYTTGDIVDALIIEHSEIGYRVIVDNLFKGMIYDNEIFSPLKIGQRIKARVKQVRPDGKIDLYAGETNKNRIDSLSERILDVLKSSGGFINISDKSDPEEIKRTFQCSKKDFKKALGHLYKERKITINKNSVKLN